MELKIAKIAQMSSARRKTLTGHAASTSQNGAVKCGGVVVNGARSNLAASSLSTSLRRTTKRTRVRLGTKLR